MAVAETAVIVEAARETSKFWAMIDVTLLIELLGLGIFAWALGYKAGYSIYIIRVVAHKST